MITSVKPGQESLRVHQPGLGPGAVHFPSGTINVTFYPTVENLELPLEGFLSEAGFK
jgi:hypothetical protein